MTIMSRTYNMPFVESTLYFLSDLSKNIFIERKTNISDIKQASWYFNEYEQDASIQSMIAALATIDKYFENLELDYESLGNFIINNLQVLYYDMENRSRGEETYVIINTTGGTSICIRKHKTYFIR